METRIIFAGFGGQGIVFMGTLLAQAGMEFGRQVTFYPSYGAAMRGGTANCSVIISDAEIASPIIPHPAVLVVMNEPSLDVFEKSLEPGGVLLINSALIHKKAARTDVTAYYVPANTISEKLGDGRMANMAMLGALLRVTGLLPLETVEKTLDGQAEKLRAKLAPNKEALRQGYDSAIPIKSATV